MKEFTLIIDNHNYYNDYTELFDYLYSLNGVEDVVITCDELLTINTKYDEKIINDEIIKLEILTFLNMTKYPCIYGFDRHSKEKLNIIKKEYHICCEYCFGNIIYTLIETKGIEKVESDFYHKYWKDTIGDYFVNIYYDKNKISKEKLDELIKEIDHYG